MIGRIRTSCQLIHRRRTIPAVDNNRFNILRLVIVLTWSQTIQRIVTITQLLQPRTEPFQILNNYMRRDITIRSLMLCFCQLPQRKVRRELHLVINIYFLHTHSYLLLNYITKRENGKTGKREFKGGAETATPEPCRYIMTVPVLRYRAFTLPLSLNSPVFTAR